MDDDDSYKDIVVDSFKNAVVIFFITLLGFGFEKLEGVLQEHGASGLIIIVVGFLVNLAFLFDAALGAALIVVSSWRLFRKIFKI